MLRKLTRSAAILALLCFGIATAGIAAIPVQHAPEIDAASGINAIALLSGAVLVVRGRKR